MDKIKIAYVVSNLKRVGPSNQTLNIIKNSKYKDNSIVVTLFEEYEKDTMIDEYRKNDIKIICLKLNRISFILSGPQKLKKVLYENRINIIHSYGVKPDCLCQKVSKKTKIIHIITLRNYPKEDILTRMNYIKGRIALHNHLRALLNCENVICCSKTIYQKMSKDYPNKIFSYIQNGVDIGKYKKVDVTTKRKLREKFKFDYNKSIFISTGSFIPRKRIEETIKGFLKGNTNNDILLLLGDGSLFNDLKNKYEKDKNIIFYGKSSNVEELLQLSDYFISSSESEGLPNGVIEAIACGLPVLLSDIPQHKEILDELKEAGVCYSLGDIDKLANIIKKRNFVNNEDINSSPFTMSNMSNRYVDYYEKIGKGKNDESQKG